MKYNYRDEIKLMVQPQEFDKHTPKEILQYAVGGLLYMPVNKTNIARKIISGEYSFVKSMVLDLEDSLGDDLIKFGQRNIVKIISELADAVNNGKISISDVPLIFIRVREPGQITETVDMLHENIRFITGFNAPKFDKHCCDKYIDIFESARERAKQYSNDELYIMPILENKSTMYRQLRMDNLLYCNNALRQIYAHVLNIRVGGSDFSNIFGMRRNRNHTIYDIGVIHSCLNDIMNVFGKSYVVSAPVWEYFGTEQGLEGLRREIELDQVNGFFGKTAIHPTQLPIIQEMNIVYKEDYLDAVGILGMNPNTTGVQKSASGRMNEVKTHSKWAKKIIGMANVYGVRE